MIGLPGADLSGLKFDFSRTPKRKLSQPMSALPSSRLLARKRVIALVVAVVTAFTFIGGSAASASASGTGTITGTVTSGGTPLPGISVLLTLPGGSIVQFASTADNGTYSFEGLPAAGYIAEFIPDLGAPYAAQWWNNEPSAASANVINLIAGGTAVADASLTAVPADATISGRIMNSNGAPVPFAMASVSPVDENQLGYGQTAGSATADASGNYTVTGLQADSYKVQFLPPYNSNYVTSFWNGHTDAAQGDTLVVAADQAVAGIDGTLGTGATISGVVDAADNPGVGLNGGQVIAQKADGNSVAYGFIGSDGKYTVPGVPTGTYTLKFQPPVETNYASTWWQGETSLASADYFSVSAGSILTGYDADLPAAASISGTLTAAGSPVGSLQGGSVYAFSTSGDGSGNTGFVGANGTYTVPGLAPGSYTLDFQAPYGDSHAQQWWHNAASPDTSTPVTLTAGQALTGINAVLGAGATISGTVLGKAASGSEFPAQGVEIDVYTVGGVLTSGGTFADDSGAYTISNLAAGSYVIDYLPAGDTTDFIPQWWKNKSSEATATPITVRGGQTKANVDVVFANSTLKAVTPKITGAAKVGHTLTAKPGKWGPGTVTFSYQWSRGGAPISGATGSTYVPTNADVASALAVTVTGSEANYTTQSLSSVSTSSVTGGVLSTVIPVITGTAAHGQALTVVAGTWGPGAVALTYKWFRGSVRIVGAIAPTYTLVKADVGKSITVKVTGAEAGFNSATVASAPTGVVH
jgi:hypothetical protein